MESLNLKHKTVNKLKNIPNNEKKQVSLSTCTSNLKYLNLEPQMAKELKNKSNDVFNNKNNKAKILAIDCEMVGIGFQGRQSMLARVSIVNEFGDCIYDTFVKPRKEVKDYRTAVSGVRKEDLLNGEEYEVVKKEVSKLIKKGILVGHSVKHDLQVMGLSHPKNNIRDTSIYTPFKKITNGKTPSLKKLAKEILGVDIQTGEHSSAEDAKVAMQLYSSL